MLRRLVVIGAALTVLVSLGAPPVDAAEPAFFRQSGQRSLRHRRRRVVEGLPRRSGQRLHRVRHLVPGRAGGRVVRRGRRRPDPAGAPRCPAERHRRGARPPQPQGRHRPRRHERGERGDRRGRRRVRERRGPAASPAPTGGPPPRTSPAASWPRSTPSTSPAASTTRTPSAGGAAIGGTTGGPVLLVLPERDPVGDGRRAHPPEADEHRRARRDARRCPKAVIDALVPYAPNLPIRRSGADRYETALQVANAFASAPVVYLAGATRSPTPSPPVRRPGSARGRSCSSRTTASRSRSTSPSSAWARPRSSCWAAPPR